MTDEGTRGHEPASPASGGSRSEACSLARRFAPLVAIAAMQLVIIAVAPSKAPEQLNAFADPGQFAGTARGDDGRSAGTPAGGPAGTTAGDPQSTVAGGPLGTVGCWSSAPASGGCPPGPERTPRLLGSLAGSSFAGGRTS